VSAIVMPDAPTPTWPNSRLPSIKMKPRTSTRSSSFSCASFNTGHCASRRRTSADFRYSRMRSHSCRFTSCSRNWKPREVMVPLYDLDLVPLRAVQRRSEPRAKGSLSVHQA
jgi:Tfp pilus assembly protein PilW